MRARVGNKVIELVLGDITEQTVDAIANAANARLAGGGGVDGAIHRAAGPTLMEECRKIGGCPTGSAVITGAGKLAVRHVLHAVGPVWHGGRSKEAELLAGAYRRCMELADEARCRTVAFPSISTGVYGYPVEEAAPVALAAVLAELRASRSVEVARFVLFDRGTSEAYEEALRRMADEADDLVLE